MISKVILFAEKRMPPPSVDSGWRRLGREKEDLCRKWDAALTPSYHLSTRFAIRDSHNLCCDFSQYGIFFLWLYCDTSVPKMGINALQILSLTTSKNRTVKPFSAVQCGFWFGGASGTRPWTGRLWVFEPIIIIHFWQVRKKGESKAFLIFMVLLELRLERNQMHIKVHYMQWKQIV